MADHSTPPVDRALRQQAEPDRWADEFRAHKERQQSEQEARSNRPHYIRTSFRPYFGHRAVTKK